MRFKTPSLESDLWTIHPKAIALALYTDAYAKKTLGRDLVVTECWRSQDEYDRIYGVVTGKHYIGPMPHLQDLSKGILCHAVDFRTVGEMTSAEAIALANHLDEAFPRPDGKPTGLFHDVTGPHLHVQSFVG
jgi:hypothetical protein